MKLAGGHYAENIVNSRESKGATTRSQLDVFKRFKADIDTIVAELTRQQAGKGGFDKKGDVGILVADQTEEIRTLTAGIEQAQAEIEEFKQTVELQKYRSLGNLNALMEMAPFLCFRQ